MIKSPSWYYGFPGWRIAARLGIPVKLKIDVFPDSEAGVYYATSAQLGLAVEAPTLEGLLDEIHNAIPVLLEITHSGIADPQTDIRLHDHLAPV
jgi:hypothetical protein